MKTVTNKSKKQSVRNRLVRLSLVSIVVLTILNTVAIYFIWRSDAKRNDGAIGTLIINAVEGLNQPVVTEPISGMVYMPPSRYVLPTAESDVGRIVYRYSEATADYPAELNVASWSDMLSDKTKIITSNTVDEVLSYVPHLQACARGVRIVDNLDSDGKPVATKKLNNGQTLYFYEEEDCNNPELLRYVQQIESY